jgi:hypothetical protein
MHGGLFRQSGDNRLGHAHSKKCTNKRKMFRKICNGMDFLKVCTLLNKSRGHMLLKGHGNEADFLGFLHKTVRHRKTTP